MSRLLLLALIWPVPLAYAASDAADAPKSPAPAAVPTKLIQDVGDTILAHHIDPPSRQEMILHGIKAVSRAAGVPAPAGLGRRVSVITTPEQFAAFVAETWPQPLEEEEKDATPERLTRAFLDGMLLAVPGGATLLTAKQAKVDEQFRGNLYVGIHVQVGFNEDEKRVQILGVLDGGPAHRAGVQVKDLIEEIDGKDTLGMNIMEILDRIRGEEGTDVEIVFRQPNAKETRRLTITRGRLFRPTIKGLRARESGGWEVRIDESAPVAYLKLDSIGGSTPHELRQFARQLESEGLRALVLDLQSITQADFHSTVLLADELLDGGTIGRVRTADRVLTFQAQPDALFRGWPLAVLIDQATAGPAEWLAAALQDNHRAILIGGVKTRGDARATTVVPVAGGDWAIELVTRTLERVDGRPIAGPQANNLFGDSGVLRMLPAMARQADRGGVTPDHNPNGAAVVKVVPGRPGVRPAPVLGVESLDLLKKEALRLLSEKLKVSGDQGQ